ncbi:MAG: IS110 family transposase, partial [Thermoprotei archaeon]
MIYVGIDLHKNYSYIMEMDEEGKVLYEFKVENDPERLGYYALSLIPGETKIAVEATYNWYYLIELLENFHLDVMLVHPLKTRATASARIMTDRISSKILADLLRVNLLPPAYIPSRRMRDMREILRHRAFLVSMRAKLKCKVRVILDKNGIKWDYSDIFGKRSLRELRYLDLRYAYKLGLRHYIRLGRLLNELIGEVTEEIEAMAGEDEDARLLITIPGIGYYSALLIVSEIGDIRRFPSARHLCSYAGLVPSVHASGGRVRYGRLTKEGSRWLRWVLVESAIHAVRGSRRFKELYERVK